MPIILYTPTRRPTRGPASRRAISAVTCGVLLAACGASDSPDSELASLDEPSISAPSGDDVDAPEASGPTTTVDPEQAFARYEDCMADFGIEMSIEPADGSAVQEVDVTASPDAGDDVAPAGPSDFAEAEETCGPILDDAFGDFELTPEQEAEMEDQMLEFEKCLDGKGFGGLVVFGDATPPDPDLDAEPSAAELDEEGFEAAMNECDEVFGEIAGLGGEPGEVSEG